MSAEDITEELPEKVTIEASGFSSAGYPKISILSINHLFYKYFNLVNYRAIQSFFQANHLLDFILNEIEHGKLLRFQSGVDNVANAVFACRARDNHFKSIRMYTEVIQASIFGFH
ncbi:unnamed protein product [Rotaria sordida]|uniref:Uncharacterized protein n=1 Tax=Rotaria sordida TaxID=392033 RepID=A0A814VE88_9BILA|nr:unnamed protein product [Rotaria sordida]CAF1189431.1 unnamed protein product [Rotaria sordida]CAF3903252.1 unnamed protein product [Rotaria sordida]CAF3942195.1 unnamed protein product [Rotaria sordida]